jgi:hypothetical protein
MLAQTVIAQATVSRTSVVASGLGLVNRLIGKWPVGLDEVEYKPFFKA